MKKILLCGFMLPILALANENNTNTKHAMGSSLQSKNNNNRHNNNQHNRPHPNRPKYNININVNPQPTHSYNSREVIYFGTGNGMWTREHWGPGGYYDNGNNQFNNQYNNQCLYLLKENKKTERHPKEEDWEWRCPR